MAINQKLIKLSPSEAPKSDLDATIMDQWVHLPDGQHNKYGNHSGTHFRKLEIAKVLSSHLNAKKD